MTIEPRSAQYFDAWYADMVHTPLKDEIEQRHLRLPAHLLSTSLLPWDGIGVVVDRLRLTPGQVLLDLGCGRGGYGLEIAGRTGASLVGIDFSAEALSQARRQAAMLGRPARFEVGDLTATGEPAGSVAGILCVDAVQFATPPSAAYAEMRRVLAPGGRVVLTTWEAVDPADEMLPPRLRAVDLRGGLTGAGFVDVEVEERPDWQIAEAALWDEAAALDPGDDPALRSFHDEGVRAVASRGRLRRMLAGATAP